MSKNETYTEARASIHNSVQSTAECSGHSREGCRIIAGIQRDYAESDIYNGYCRRNISALDYSKYDRVITTF